MDENARRFDLIIKEIFDKELNPEQKSLLCNDSAAMKTLRQSIETICKHAGASIATQPESDAPLCVIPGCKKAARYDIGWVSELKGEYGIDYMYQQYPESKECSVILKAFPGSVNISALWSVLKKMGTKAIFNKAFTVQQVEELIPYLRTRALEQTWHYLIPIQGYDCIDDYREEHGKKNGATNDGLLFLQITAYALESEQTVTSREIGKNVIGQMSLNDSDLDIMPAYNEAEVNRAVLFVD